MMAKARIFQPAKTAMQSGRGKTQGWVLEYPRKNKVSPDPLMGWQSSSDTRRQVRLRFPTVEAAIQYCEQRDIAYTISTPQKRKIRLKAYADNFSTTRVGSWTH